MSSRANGHYEYTIAPIETEYRIKAAKAMIEKRDSANAVFYLRFWAYCLARCPIIQAEAMEGKNPAFYVPFDPLMKSLQKSCPEIIDDLMLIMGPKLDRAQADESIRNTADFRSLVAKIVERERGGIES